MDKKTVIKSFGHLFQDFLYRSKLVLSVRNMNAFIKSESWDQVYNVTKIYNAGVNIEITFKYREIGTQDPWKAYQADWKLKM